MRHSNLDQIGMLAILVSEIKLIAIKEIAVTPLEMTPVNGIPLVKAISKQSGKTARNQPVLTPSLF